MIIEKHRAYIDSGGLTYICIGFTEHGDAILAPYWSDDEDSSPEIQDEKFVIFLNTDVNHRKTELTPLGEKGEYVGSGKLVLE